MKRMMHAAIRATPLAGAGFWLLLLAGCADPGPFVTGPNIEELRVVALRAEHQALPNVIGPPGTPAPLRPVLRVGLSTEPNLPTFSRRNRFYISLRASLCREPAIDTQRMVTDGVRLRDRLGEVDDPDRRAMNPDAAAAGQPEAVLPLVRPGPGDVILPGSRFRFAEIDLRHEPSDLCIELFGGSFFSQTHRSAVVLIPYAAIRQALDAAGM